MRYISSTVVTGAAMATSALLALGSPVSAEPVHCASRSFNVYFAQFEDRLGDDARKLFQEEQRSFRSCKIKHVRVIGSAGSPGDPASNQVLSEKRSRLVADMLVAGGWSRADFELVSLGDRHAKKGDQERPIHRRVRVEVRASPLD